VRSGVYETALRPSVCPIGPSHADAAGLLPWAGRAGDIDQLLHGDAGGQQQCAADECGQCHVDS